jgi:hypothetical protein
MPRRRELTLLTLLIVATGLTISGCATTSNKTATAPSPTLRAQSAEYAGTVLSGPQTTRIGPLDPAFVTRVEVTWLTVDRVPASTRLISIDAQSKLTFSPANPEAVLPSGVLTRTARFATSDTARRFRDTLFSGSLGNTRVVGWSSGLIAPGTALGLNLSEDPRPTTQPRRVAFLISRPGPATTQPAATAPADTQPSTEPSTAATVAISIDDYLPSTSGNRSLGQETALLGALPAEDGSLMAVVVPMTFNATPWRSVVGLVELHTASVADSGALAQLRENLDKSALTAVAATRPAPAGLDLPSAVVALYSPSGFRQPLLFLATQTDASIAGDFTLVADDAMLTKLAAQTKTTAAKEDPSKWRQTMGWEMDRASLALMADALDAPNPPPGVVSVLLTWGGEAGRHADLIREILKSSPTPADLNQRLIAENLILLEDNSPAARVRAYDWLNSKGKAPPGFDPLGSLKSRRAALDQALGGAGGTHE